MYCQDNEPADHFELLDISNAATMDQVRLRFREIALTDQRQRAKDSCAQDSDAGPRKSQRPPYPPASGCERTMPDDLAQGGPEAVSPLVEDQGRSSAFVTPAKRGAGEDLNNLTSFKEVRPDPTQTKSPSIMHPLLTSGERTPVKAGIADEDSGEPLEPRARFQSLSEHIVFLEEQKAALNQKKAAIRKQKDTILQVLHLVDEILQRSKQNQALPKAIATARALVGKYAEAGINPSFCAQLEDRIQEFEAVHSAKIRRCSPSPERDGLMHQQAWEELQHRLEEQESDDQVSSSDDIPDIPPFI